MEYMQTKQALNIVVSGRVQRVGYRNFVLEKAIELSIKGYVYNQADGTVFVHAIGSHSQLDHFLECCQSGSPLSKVRKIQVTPVNGEECKEFKIKRV